MTYFRKRSQRWLFGPLLVVAIALIAAACGGDDGDTGDLATEVAALRSEVAELRETANTALLRASLSALEVARFHEMDERINNEGRVQATDPGFLSRAEQVLSSRIWPAALQPNVDQFRDAVVAALPFVIDNDPAGAGRLVLIAHANSHEFEEAVAAYFAGEDVPAPPALGDGAGHEHAADDSDVDAAGHSPGDNDDDAEHEADEDHASDDEEAESHEAEHDEEDEHDDD